MKYSDNGVNIFIKAFFQANTAGTNLLSFKCNLVANK